MAEAFEIKFDAKEATIFFKNLKVNLEKIAEPLERTGKMMQSEALANFPDKGKVFEESWPPLRESTVKKKEKCCPGKPMMVRTGILKGSFEIERGKDYVEVSNPVFYALFHQRGTSKIPRRVLLKITKRQVDKIVQIFSGWVKRTIEKS